MKKSSSIYLLIIILGLAFLLRGIFLGTIPNGFYCDEASNGYDAYSILQTGRDRYGEFLPLFLKGFGNDYRESIYVFLTLPLIKFFGLNEFATRLTAAVIGTFTVITVYYLAPNFLFFKGDPNLRHSPGNIGELHYFELLTVPLGILFLLRENRKERAILMLWLFLYPIPAALTEPAHAIRSIVGAPLLAIFSAYGFTQSIDWLRFKRQMLFFTTFAIVALSLAIFYQRYFSEYPLKVTEEWQYGIREAITYAEKSSYDCVVMTDDDYHCLNLYNFSAFIPFYTQYPPAKYQLSPTIPWSQDREQNINFDKYSMEAISRQSELNQRCLFIIHPEEVKFITARGYSYKEVHLVKDSRGVEYFKLIEISK